MRSTIQTVISSSFFANLCCVQQAITRARMAFIRDVTKNVNFRVEQLKALYRLLDENKDLIVSALKQDLRKVSFH